VDLPEVRMSNKPTAVIEFTASVNKVQTMVDGGLRVILDFSENDVMQASMLMECKRYGVPLKIIAEPAEIEQSKRKSYV
jgi:hypothetical protein